MVYTHPTAIKFGGALVSDTRSVEPADVWGHMCFPRVRMLDDFQKSNGGDKSWYITSTSTF